jgi:quercetin dioxygenase-like cupin family protein
MRSPTAALTLVVAIAACGAPSEDAAEQVAEAPPAAAGAPAQEQVTRRVPQFENDQVEVWKSIILPGQPLSMHRHEFGRTIIALKGGTLTVVSDAGAERDMTWETGSAYWLGADPPGELHGDVNRGTEPIEVIVVQMKGN